MGGYHIINTYIYIICIYIYVIHMYTTLRLQDLDYHPEAFEPKDQPLLSPTL